MKVPSLARFRAAAPVAAALLLQAGAQAQSVPIGAIHGTAKFKQDGNNLLVTTTNGAGYRSVIDWKSFGVPAGSRTWFAQPNSASTSINRVTGGLRSDIFGTLGSNGSLVLVNPSGIAIGRGAVIDTAGFTAAALELGASDAIAGRLLFQGGAAGIRVGEGARVLARSGDVVLVGSSVQVERNAVVRAHGAAILAAGEKVEITGRGLEGIHLEVQAGHEAVNLGSLKGDAVGIFAGTLRHSGLVVANAVTAEGGKIVLQATGDSLVEGGLVASGAGGKGGSIALRAGNALVLRRAVILAGDGEGGLGSFTATGNSVEVEDSAILNANWTNESSVTVRGVAVVAGGGATFSNRAPGVLSGNGTLVATVDNFGTIAPGGLGTVGTLSIFGNLVMEPGSLIAADLVDPGNHDKLLVSGTIRSGGSFAVNYPGGASFSTGDRFPVLQSGALDATTVPVVNKAELLATASGNDLVLVATAPVPPVVTVPPVENVPPIVTVPPVVTVPPATGPIAGPDLRAQQAGALQVVNNQAAAFAELFARRLDETSDKRMGDGIVLTDTACTR